MAKSPSKKTTKPDSASAREARVLNHFLKSKPVKHAPLKAKKAEKAKPK